jgi:hypothetical protein
MYDPQRHTDSSLNYTIVDCLEAVSASPDNPKARQYLDLIDACRAELRKRSTIRMYRRHLRNLKDPLVGYGVRSRWPAVSGNRIQYRYWHEACIALRLLKKSASCGNHSIN